MMQLGLKSMSLAARLTFFNFLVLLPTLLIVQFYVIPEIRLRLLNDRQLVVQSAVEVANGVVTHYIELASQNKLTTPAAQQAAKEALRPLRYHTSEYFFVLDQSHIMILHPIKPALEGKSQYDAQDPSGKFLFRDMAEVAKNGGGFVSYLWPKPNEDQPQPKISFVKLTNDWGWVVGNGVYVDDINKDMKTLMLRTWAGIAIASIISFVLAFINTRRVAKTLESTVATLEQLEDNLSRASFEIENSSESLSQSTTRSAAAIEQTNASTEQVINAVNINEKYAQEAHELSQKSHDVALGGKSQVDLLIAATQKIDAGSKKIEAIVSVIDDIALQTSLLSLNAAIEAARAGEQGKGFAVVAESVRNLAQRSAVSAKDISLLIRESAENVKEGVELAEASGHALGEIVQSVSRVMNLNKDIAEASHQQAHSLAEINKAISELDAVSQKNASSSEEALDVARKLKTESTDLKTAVVDLVSVVRGRAA